MSHQYSGCSKLEERKAEFLAKEGYFAFAIDLYGKGIRGNTPEESLDLMNQLSSDRNILSNRINHCLNLLKENKLVNRNKIAAIGYCFGGKCVLDLARSGAELNLIVSFHGIYDRPNIENPKIINTPILILHGDEDPYATEDDLKKLLNELKEKILSGSFIFLAALLTPQIRMQMMNQMDSNIIEMLCICRGK